MAIRADRRRLEVAIAELRSEGFQGLNITMPLKGDAADLSDRLSAEATLTGSVNALRARNGEVEGHSTDVVAFREILSAIDPGVPVLLLGSGGSARAALGALRDRPVFVSARSPNKAHSLENVHSDLSVVPFGTGIGKAVVVNATPIGMNQECLPTEVLSQASSLIDLPYGGIPTPAVRYMEAENRPVVDGIEFLAHQAIALFHWWTGVVVDLAVAIGAARNV